MSWPDLLIPNLRTTEAAGLRGAACRRPPPVSIDGTTRRAWLLASAAALLSGCGFKLRGAEPLAVQRVALAGFAARSPMAAALRRLLAPQVHLLDDPNAVDAIVVALDERREKALLAATPGKLVREVQLRTRFRFRVDRRGGATGLPATELAQSRDMSTSETLALAKAHEEADLFLEMEAEIARQVVQRLAVLKP
jgi:LPS-assembly lipoprotein